MTDQVLRTICLHGALAERFGGPFQFAVSSPAEAVRALCQLEGFRDALAGGSYRVVVRERDQGDDDLALTFGAAAGMDLIPVAEGAARGGVGKIILGTLLIVAAFHFAPVVAGGLLEGSTAATATAAGTGLGASAGFGITYGQIAMFGTSVLLGGVSQFLTPTPGLSDLSREGPAGKPGFLFGGAATGIEQGGPVPLIFGRVRVGGLVVSSGLTAEHVDPCYEPGAHRQKIRASFDGNFYCIEPFGFGGSFG